MISSKKKNFFRRYIESIISIIEDKSDNEISLFIYMIIIFVSYFQIGIYLFEETAEKRLQDIIMTPIVKVFRFLSLNYILIEQNSDFLSGLCFLFSQIFLYAYFFYVLAYTILKNYFVEYFENYNSFFQKINKLLNMYFCFYLNIFFNYQLELSASVVFCSDKSLFQTQRLNHSACVLQSWQMVFGIGGLVMCLFTAFICLFFFRNYEFLEENLIKRKLSNLYMIQISTKFSITLIEYSGLSQIQRLAIKHTLLQTYGILSLIDATVNNPYQHQGMSKFNISISSIFVCFVSIFNLWMYSDFVRDKEIFYLLAVGIVVFSSFFRSLDQCMYEKCMNSNIYQLGESSSNSKMASFNYNKYVNELVKLGKESSKIESSKIKIQKLICYHIEICRLQSCFCHSYKLEDNNLSDHHKNDENSKDVEVAKKRLFLTNNERDVEVNSIMKLADSIFRWLLEQKVIQQKQSEYEYLILQYITFMIKCLNNHTRANYYLKLYMQRRKHRGSSFSLYFQIITQQISEQIENIISQMNENLLSLKRKEELTIKHIVQADKLCYDFMPIFQEVLIQKQQMWTRMQNGFKSMNKFEGEAIKLMQFIKKVNDDFMRNLQVLQKQKDYNNCLILKKITLLFYLLALNDTMRAVELEEDVIDLRKRDAFLEEDCLNNENLVKKNIITVNISISENIGKITSTKDVKTAEFFGYNIQEFQRIQKINELMPSFIAINHDSYLNTFVKRGSSKYIKSSFVTFCQHKLGYIMPIKIHSDFSFISLDDFYLSGTILKIDKGSQFLLFDKSGKILGLSRLFAEKLVVESSFMKDLPIAEYLHKQLNAFTLIPRILKKLYKKKKEIFEGYKTQSSEIIHQDDHGYITLNDNFLHEASEFSNFLNKTFSSSYQQKRTKKMNNSLTASSQRNQMKNDMLNILERDSFKKYRQFQLNKCKSLKDESEKSSFIQSATAALIGVKINATKQIKTLQKNISKEHHKLTFKYILSYHTLPYVQNNNNNKEYKHVDEKDQERSFFFSLRMNDLKLHEVNNKDRKSTPLKCQIVNCLKSTTCVPALVSYLSPQLLFSQQNNYYSSEDQEYIDELEQDDLQYSDDIKIKPIPKHYLQFLNIVMNQGLKRNSKDLNIFGSEQSNHHSTINKVNKYLQSTEEKQQSQSSNSISESSENTNTNQSTQENIEQVIGEFKDYNQKNNPIIQQITQQFEKLNDNKLDDFLQQKNICIDDMLEIDPYYKARRVISSNLNSSSFIKILEFEIAKALMEIRVEKQNLNDEKQQQNQQKQENDQEDFQLIYDMDEIQNQQQTHRDHAIITFRTNNQQDNDDIYENIDKHLNPYKQNKNDSKTFIYPKTQVTDESQFKKNGIILNKNISKPKDDNSVGLDVSNVQQTYNDYQNISQRPLQLDVSTENLTNYQDQNSNYFSSYARPTFQKSIQLNNEIDPDDLLIFPSSFNDIQNSFQNNSQIMSSKINDQSSVKTELKAQMKQAKSIKIKQDKQNRVEQEAKIEFTGSSNSKIDEENKTKGTNFGHEKLMNDLLNQGGLVEGKGEIVSIHSSSRSTSFYGGNFLKGIQYLIISHNICTILKYNYKPALCDQNKIPFLIKQIILNQQIFFYLTKEIIMKNKIPSGAKTYSLILLVFTCVYLSLNLANLTIIKNDMEVFATNVIVIRFPRRFHRDYCKTTFSYLLKIQLETKMLTDTANKDYSKNSDTYRTAGLTAYNTLYEQNQYIILEYGLSQQQSEGIYEKDFIYYQDFIKYQEKQNTALLFKMPIFFLFGIQKNQTDILQRNGFLTLKNNYYRFSQDVENFALYVFDDTLKTVDTLIMKFQYICIAAIICLFLIPIFSIPVAKQINTYEEKILLIVSRINYDHSQVERQKLHICQQLLSLENYDWLKYTYHELFYLKHNQFDVSVINSNQDLSILSSAHRQESSRARKKDNLQSGRLESSRVKSARNQKIDNSQSKNQQSTIKQSNFNSNTFKNALKGNYKKPDLSFAKSAHSNADFGKDKRQNYILQTKIQDQKLSTFYHIRSLLVFMMLLICYFLVIIFYLSLNTETLKAPVLINRKTNLLHIYAIKYIFSTELLAFDSYIQKLYWPKYVSEYNQTYYYENMKQSIVKMQQIELELTDIIYGKNPYNATAVKVMKDLMEGYVCPYLTKNNCTGDLTQKTDYGIVSAISNFVKLDTSYDQMLKPGNQNDQSIQKFLNSNERIKLLLQGFQRQDEVWDLFSSNANGNIGIVSKQIQNFLETYLTYCGTVLTIVMVFTFIYSWKKLYKNILLINFFLTFIPEEKLIEDITLHLLKSLRKM